MLIDIDPATVIDRAFKSIETSYRKATCAARCPGAEVFVVARAGTRTGESLQDNPDAELVIRVWCLALGCGEGDAIVVSDVISACDIAEAAGSDGVWQKRAIQLMRRLTAKYASVGE